MSSTQNLGVRSFFQFKSFKRKLKTHFIKSFLKCMNSFSIFVRRLELELIIIVIIIIIVSCKYFSIL